MYFDHEKLIVYQKSIEFVAFVVAVGAFSLDEITPGKALLFPVVKMLSKMTEYPTVAREEMAPGTPHPSAAPTGYGSQDALGNGQQEQESRL